MRRDEAPHAMLTDMGGQNRKAVSWGCEGFLGTGRGGRLIQQPGQPLERLAGRSKPRGVSRMAQTQSHYRFSPPLLQGAENDLHTLSAWKSQEIWKVR